MSKKEIVLLSQTESLERLLYRLPEHHPKRPFLQIELYRTAAGKREEKRLEQKLVEFSPDENHRFVRNICLSLGDWKVQMDGLLLTERGAIVIESKNISAQLSNRQLRQFCNFESPYVASRLLATFDFEIEGALRNRTYQLKNKD